MKKQNHSKWQWVVELLVGLLFLIPFLVAKFVKWLEIVI